MKKISSLVLVFLVLLLFPAGILAADGSKDAPTQVIPPEPSEITAVRKAVDAEIDSLSPRLIEMSKWIHDHPEPGFLEFEAAGLITKELEKHGFVVERGVPGLPKDFDRLKIIGGIDPSYDGPSGLPTAFRAKYKGKSESPVIGFFVEYDALRGNPPFHGCQHNMQGPTGIGAAIALGEVMEEKQIPGSVWVFGTPAEEIGPPSKAYMANAGYFDGTDFLIRSHGSPAETELSPGGYSERHIRQMHYTFHGKASHAQRAWQGISALDAALLFFQGVDMLREHSEPQFRFHGVITEGGIAPNIVPQKVTVPYWVRYLIDRTAVGDVSPKVAGEMIDAKVKQLDNIAKGAALATGCTVDISPYGSYVPAVSVGALNKIAYQYAVDYGGKKLKVIGIPKSYEETGMISLKVPGVRVGLNVEGIKKMPGHSEENRDASISPAGQNCLILTSKAMAAVGLRLAMDKERREEVKKEQAALLAEYNN